MVDQTHMICCRSVPERYGNGVNAIENAVANKINVTFMWSTKGRLGELPSSIHVQSMAFPYSDWLYFLWHGT